MDFAGLEFESNRSGPPPPRRPKTFPRKTSDIFPPKHTYFPAKKTM
jgi:hypothetical protein